MDSVTILRHTGRQWQDTGKISTIYQRRIASEMSDSVSSRPVEKEFFETSLLHVATQLQPILVFRNTIFFAFWYTANVLKSSVRLFDLRLMKLEKTISRALINCNRCFDQVWKPRAPLYTPYLWTVWSTVFAPPWWQISGPTKIRAWYIQVTSPSRYEWAIGRRPAAY